MKLFIIIVIWLVLGLVAVCIDDYGVRNSKEAHLPIWSAVLGLISLIFVLGITFFSSPANEKEERFYE